MTDTAVIHHSPAKTQPATVPRVLLVDFDDDVRATTARVLQDAGMTVSQANSTIAAVAVLRGNWQPTVVVTEFRLEPGAHGLDLMKVTHRLMPRLPVILYTDSPLLHAQRARQAGAWDVVIKLSQPTTTLISRIHNAHASYSATGAE